MITESKKDVRIPIEEWEKLKENPAIADTLELLEDIADLENSKKEKGEDISLKDYLEKRGLSDKS